MTSPTHIFQYIVELDQVDYNFVDEEYRCCLVMQVNTATTITVCSDFYFRKFEYIINLWKSVSLIIFLHFFCRMLPVFSSRCPVVLVDFESKFSNNFLTRCFFYFVIFGLLLFSYSNSFTPSFVVPFPDCKSMSSFLISPILLLSAIVLGVLIPTIRHNWFVFFVSSSYVVQTSLNIALYIPP